MKSFGRKLFPFITENGDIILSLRDSRLSEDCTTVLSIRKRRGKLEANVVSRDSAEGIIVVSGYAWRCDNRELIW